MPHGARYGAMVRRHIEAFPCEDRHSQTMEKRKAIPCVMQTPRLSNISFGDQLSHCSL